MANFRIAEEKDAERIAHLHAISWQRTYRGNFRDEFLDGDVFSDRGRVWRERLTNPAENQLVYVVEEHHNTCGFICAFGGHDPRWGSFIDNLHVDKAYQGRGIGYGLMTEAGSWLSARFAKAAVYLIVWESNPSCLFYERLGGRNTGMIEVENPGGGVGRYIRIAWD